MGYLDENNSADNLRRIVQRLPFHLCTKFVEVVDTIQQSGRRPNIKDISAFVAAKERATNNPVFGSVMDVTPDNKPSGTKSKSSFKSRDTTFTCITTLNTQGTASCNQGNQSRCGSGSGHLNAKFLACPACNRNHVLMKCQNFERKTFDERVQIMRKAQICHNCFQYGHIAQGCPAKGACQVYGCKRRHHTLLHLPYQQRSRVRTVKRALVSPPRYHRLYKMFKQLKPPVSPLPKVDSRTLP